MNNFVKFEVVLIQIGIFLISPFFLVCLFWGFILKQFIQLFASLQRKDFIPVESADLMFICDKFNEKPHSGFNVLFHLRGHTDEQTVTNALQAVYNLRGQNGERFYWKLGLFPVKYFGYWFWSRIPDFQIRNQVYTEEEFNKPFSDKDINKLVEKVFRRKFPKNSPVWDVSIFINHPGSNTIIIFRTSHAIMDGYSFAKLVFPLAGKELPDGIMAMDNTSQTPFSIKKQASFILDMMTKGLQEYLTIWHSLPEKNSFRKGTTKNVSPSGQWICSFSPKIPVKQVKLARKAFNTSFYGIILSGVVGGLRNFAVSQGMSVPDSVKTMIPSSKPNHPNNTLCNHWRALIIDLPMGGRDPLDTIQDMHQALTKWSASTSSEFGRFVFFFCSILPVANYIDEITKFDGLTLISSIASAANSMPRVFGKEIIDFFHYIPLNRESLAALSWACVSCEGNFRIALTADQTYFPTREIVNQLADMIHKEFLEIFALAKNQGI